MSNKKNMSNKDTQLSNKQELENDKFRLKWLKTLLRMKIQDISERLEEIHNLKCDDFSKSFARECVKLFIADDIPDIEKEIYQLQRKLNPPKTPSNFERALDDARNISIMQVAERFLAGIKRSGSRFVAPCPFHQEKSPSFVIYPDSNTYHCFGCGEHGDTISLMQNINNLTFKEAVASLVIL